MFSQVLLTFFNDYLISPWAIPVLIPIDRMQAPLRQHQPIDLDGSRPIEVHPTSRLDSYNTP
jgi:hypothetical protein